MESNPESEQMTESDKPSRRAYQQNRKPFRKTGSKSIGRLLIALIFLGLAAVHAEMVFKIPSVVIERNKLIAIFFVINLWNFTLSAGTWNRQSWARAGFITLVFVEIAVAALGAPAVLALHPSILRDLEVQTAIFIGSHFVAALILLNSVDIKRITSRSFD